MTLTPTSLADDLVAALDTVRDHPTLLVAVDFDGVLAPIVEAREDARVLPGSSEALARLSRREGVHLAVVSGRMLADLQDLATFPAGTLLVGSHGSEFSDAVPELSETEQALHDRVQFFLESVVRDHPSCELEVKPVSIALHTRRASRDEALVATVQAVVGAAKIPGVHITAGKEVVELSVTRVTKGDALSRLRSTLLPHSIVYLGDDITDESAFAAMGPADVSIKVGPGHTAARFRVDGPADVEAVLARIADGRPRLSTAGPPTAGFPAVSPPAATPPTPS